MFFFSDPHTPAIEELEAVIERERELARVSLRVEFSALRERGLDDGR
jgi:hypothetical protein